MHQSLVDGDRGAGLGDPQDLTLSWLDQRALALCLNCTIIASFGFKVTEGPEAPADTCRLPGSLRAPSTTATGLGMQVSAGGPPTPHQSPGRPLPPWAFGAPSIPSSPTSGRLFKLCPRPETLPPGIKLVVLPGLPTQPPLAVHPAPGQSFCSCLRFPRSPTALGYSVLSSPPRGPQGCDGQTPNELEYLEQRRRGAWRVSPRGPAHPPPRAGYVVEGTAGPGAGAGSLFLARGRPLGAGAAQQAGTVL
ncbi:uncharacterized protein [Eschrichtius robustus]|uniref:uncharacterized protein n=1 Tax=Eschrichtius robustus TaxID=9764 RepID=UPI0035BF55BE